MKFIVSASWINYSIMFIMISLGELLHYVQNSNTSFVVRKFPPKVFEHNVIEMSPKGQNSPTTAN